MTSDGSPWRPVVHVADICDAVRATLGAPREDVHGQVLNVGRNDANHRVREIAEVVADVFPGCRLTIGTSDGDRRSYRVSFDKIGEVLPSFAPRRDVRLGALQLREMFERVGLDEDRFRWRGFTRLDALNHLLATGQVDDELRWRPMPTSCLPGRSDQVLGGRR